MSTFSVSGLISGIDYNSMIEQIIELERQPIALKEDRQEAYETKISKYGELSSLLDTLKTASEELKTATDFYARTAEAGDEDVCNVTASSTASEGNYTVVVTRLAQAYRVASSAVASETATIASGSGNFSFQVGTGDAVTVAVDATTTLDGPGGRDQLRHGRRGGERHQRRHRLSPRSQERRIRRSRTGSR